MYRRSPLGNPLVWLVACLVLPEVVKRCKPLAKTLGDVMVKAGESFQKAAAEPEKASVAEKPASEAAPAEPEPATPPAAKHKKSKAEPADGDPAAEV